MVTQLGFINPQAQAVVLDINMFNRDKITRITSFVGGIPTYSKLEGLRFSIGGILKEFPDLKNKEPAEMKKIALERFKKHIRKFKTEKELISYLKEDLEKHGYKLTQILKPGFRPQKVK